MTERPGRYSKTIESSFMDVLFNPLAMCERREPSLS